MQSQYFDFYFSGKYKSEVKGYQATTKIHSMKKENILAETAY